MQFNLLDVSFDVNFQDNPDRTSDGLSVLQKRGDPGYAKNLRYPNDLGNADKSHYMMFTIYQQENTMFKGTESNFVPGIGNRSAEQSQGYVDLQSLTNQGVTAGFGPAAGSFSNLLKDSSAAVVSGIQQMTAGSNIGSYADAAVYATKPITDQLSSIVDRGASTTASNFNRRIRRIEDSIALYVPDSLMFQYPQQYSSIGMNQGKAGLGGVAVSALDQIRKVNRGLPEKQYANEISKIAGANLSPFLSQFVRDKLGAPGDVISADLFGGVQNPMLELLYSSPDFRSFNFDFMFYPRNKKESTEVYNIINTFKFHSAPEIKPGNAGFFLVPPSVFNIQFFYNGKLNENLPLISDCVLTDITVDYAPNGWASYEMFGDNNPSVGGTGAPVGIRMSLQFRETVILTKGLHLNQNREKINR